MAKIAIVTFTRGAAEIGRRLSPELGDSHLYLNEKFMTGVQPGVFPVNEADGALMATIFANYERVILVTSLGNAVRLIAPSLVGPAKPIPAIVLVDPAERHAISIMGGKGDEADNLAERLSRILAANLVVTSSCETHKVPSPDLLGREHGWEIQNRKHLKAAAAAMVAGESVAVVQHAGERDWLEGGLPDHIRLLESLDAFDPGTHKACLLISDRAFDPEVGTLPEVLVVYRPKSLSVAIECSANPKADLVQMAITKVLMDRGLSFRSIRNLFTTEESRAKSGITHFAARHHFPVEYVKGASAAEGGELPRTESMLRELVSGAEILVPETKALGQFSIAVGRVTKKGQ